MRRRLVSLVLGLVGIALGVAAVVALREATLSTHSPVAPDSRAVVILEARANRPERGRSLDMMVEALLLACRLEVGRSELDGPIADLGDGRFRATFVPALDQTNRRQLRGCLEDWTLDQLLVDVLSISRP